MEKQIFEKTDGIRGKAGEEPVTEVTMRGVANAVGQYLGADGIVVVGRDSRKSGEWILAAVKEGLAKAGMTVWDLGIVSTPCLAYIVKSQPEAIGGIIVTASHNPASDNGLKVFDAKGNKFTDEMEVAVEKLFFEGFENKGAFVEILDKEELKKNYLEALTEVCDGLHGGRIKIGVDSASGGAWELSRELFKKLGFEMVELSAAPNGENINELNGALHPEKLAAKISELGLDFGITLDGDADRIILVDGYGRIWDGDRVVALLACELGLKQVVLTEYSNLGALQYLKTKGIGVEKVVVGDKEVAKRCQDIGIRLGGEAAGHLIDLNWLSSSDGLYAALLVLKLVVEKGKSLAELWPDYEMFPQKTWNIKVKEKVPLEEIEGWADALAEQIEFLGENGRTLVRYSGTEKKLRIMVECNDAVKMERAGEALSKVIEAKLEVEK